MQTVGEKFMGRIRERLLDMCGGRFEMVRSDGSTDLLGRIDVVLKEGVHQSVLQFTYHFGPHSWHPIIVHHSPEMNEDIQVFRWNAIDRGFDAIIEGVKEQALLTT